MCVFSTVWQRVALTHFAAANSKARAIENTHGEQNETSWLMKMY